MRASANRRHRRQNAHQERQAPHNAQVRRGACFCILVDTPLYGTPTTATSPFCCTAAMMRTRIFSFESNDENVAVVYAKLHLRVNESSALRENLDAVRYIGERKTTRSKRADVTDVTSCKYGRCNSAAHAIAAALSSCACAAAKPSATSSSTTICRPSTRSAPRR